MEIIKNGTQFSAEDLKIGIQVKCELTRLFRHFHTHHPGLVPDQ